MAFHGLRSTLAHDIWGNLTMSSNALFKAPGCNSAAEGLDHRVGECPWIVRIVRANSMQLWLSLLLLIVVHGALMLTVISQILQVHQCSKLINKGSATSEDPARISNHW